MGETIQTQTFAQAQYDFFWQLVATNVQYLAIAVSIIVGTGILLTIGLYFINFRPLIRRISEQERDLKKLGEVLEETRQTNEEKFLELTATQESKLTALVTTQEKSFKELTNKLENASKTSIKEISTVNETAKKLINEVKEKVNEMEILAEWQNHYLWQASKVPTNVIRALISCVEKSTAYKSTRWIIPLCLKEIDQTLQDYPNDFKSSKIPQEIEELISSNELGNEERVEKIREHLSKLT